MTTGDVPAVGDTELDRGDLEKAAKELSLEGHERLDDQALFERIGRRLGEIDDEDAAQVDDGGPSVEYDGSGPDLQEMTRDELRGELRALGLPVAGSKSDLQDRVEAARRGAAKAHSQAPTDPAGQGARQDDHAAETATGRTVEATEPAHQSDGAGMSRRRRAWALRARRSAGSAAGTAVEAATRTGHALADAVRRGSHRIR